MTAHADASIRNSELVRPLRVVHVEDDLQDAELVRASLARDGLACEIVGVGTRRAFLAALDRGDVDLVLADDTPTLDALTALRLTRSRRPPIPFLFVSATSGEEVAIESLKSGAHDYVLKEHLARLPFAVRRALREAHERTERHGAEQRVRELNTKLEIAKREAERANQAKSAFLTRMSHDLRTPLNAILGFAQLLDLNAVVPDQHDQVLQILHAGRHLLDLINGLLDITRIEAGHMDLMNEPVPVSLLVHQAMNLVGPLAAQRGVVLADDSTSSVGACVMADRRRLTQILLNLLSNAIKYNRPGGHVTVTCSHLPSRRLRLNVTDNGPGLDPERLTRLFRPFERLGAEQGGTEGTGLGLALSKGLAEAMGGAMGAISEVGRGSTFWIELTRAADTPADTPPSEVHDEGAPSIVESLTTAGTVLYIEDNPSNLRLMERLCGHRPRITLVGAKEGRVGIDLACTLHPNLILLDLHLPDVSGEDIFRQLRESERTCDIPVVVLSADAAPAQIERFRQTGAAAYLTKPLDITEVLHTLDIALGPCQLATREIACP